VKILDKFIIEGGKKLRGKVKISGSKNAALPIMASCLLASGKSVIKNVPLVQDVWTMKKMLETLGAQVDFRDGSLIIDSSGDLHYEAPNDLIKTMRASYYVLGPLLARLGRARVSLPGGCAIGVRPIDLHLKGLRSLGARIKISHGYIEAKGNGLKGAKIFLGGPHGSSVGATINVMMGAVLAKGKTIIQFAACEPEVKDTANFLNKMGAKIEGVGTSLLSIEGVPELKGVEYTIIPDRIEAGTFALAAAITRGEVEIENCNPLHFQSVWEKLEEMGVRVISGEDSFQVKRRGKLKPSEVKVAPYPGFPTDLQAPMMALMAITEGISVITETIFENRFLHVGELMRMGADITIQGNSAIVKGVKRLSGAPVMASDLRGSAALVLAGLVAEGETHISRVYHLDRGYERFEKKLESLGAKIRRVKE